MPKENQVRQVHFRLSEVEYEKLSISSETFGLTVSQYAKSRALKSRLVKPKFFHDDAVKINFQLGKIGNNLNQLAKQANQGHSVDQSELALVREELNRLWQQLN